MYFTYFFLSKLSALSLNWIQFYLHYQSAKTFIFFAHSICLFDFLIFYSKLLVKCIAYWLYFLPSQCLFYSDAASTATTDQDMIFCLQTLSVICGEVALNLRPCLEDCLAKLCNLVGHRLKAIRSDHWPPFLLTFFLHNSDSDMGTVWSHPV